MVMKQLYSSVNHASLSFIVVITVVAITAIITPQRTPRRHYHHHHSPPPPLLLSLSPSSLLQSSPSVDLNKKVRLERNSPTGHFPIEDPQNSRIVLSSNFDRGGYTKRETVSLTISF